MPKILVDKILLTTSVLLLSIWTIANAEPLPGGTLDPTSIDKYVTPLLIPPAMPKSKSDKRVDYQIAVRQFEQQVLPEGMAKTTVWGYGSVDHPGTVAEGGTFNFPAFTVEAITNKRTKVRWINDLVDENRNFLPHLLTGAVDQTLHWANPPMDCLGVAPRTDCAGRSQKSYEGPVPIVTHVHGAHVRPESDGYPEAWWLPDAVNIPVNYASRGTFWDQARGFPVRDGEAVFRYPNTQRSSILWYHDHTLGMTRLNVYAGPAGFWILRNEDGEDDGIDDDQKLPGPAPQRGDKPGKKYYDIPIVIQDRSFNADGSLFYPDNRAFFEGLTPADLQIDFTPDSDIAPIWNPEAFFNTMVVNGNTWPFLKVDRTRYRFRMLNGCNSRFLNLAMHVVNKDGSLGQELPFFVIGAEGGLIPRVVEVRTGQTRIYRKGGKKVVPGPTVHAQQALLMAPAERFDVIVEFNSLKPGTRVRMINTAPDAPFGGFPDVPADPGTTGQVMEFVVGEKKGPKFDNPRKYDMEHDDDDELSDPKVVRHLSLNEEESQKVCVVDDNGRIIQLPDVLPPDCGGIEGAVPFGPKAALLGLYDPVNDEITTQLWADPITQNPRKGATEEWVMWNFSADAHPIHLHLVTFEVINREDMATGVVRPVEPWETGRKDTVISYPGEITRIKAKFDIQGLYVWHCHIVEHEDNEMMLPFCVGKKNCPLPIASGS